MNANWIIFIWAIVMFIVAMFMSMLEKIRSITEENRKLREELNRVYKEKKLKGDHYGHYYYVPPENVIPDSGISAPSVRTGT